MKKFLLAALLAVTVFASGVFAADVEDALTSAPEQSVYMVLKLDDTQNLLKWIFSKEHIDTFMPLILASEESNEILGAVEMISAFAENTPLKSAALLVGVYSEEKSPVPFFKMAFTVKDDAAPFVKKIADGTAEAVDIAKLVMGKDNPMASLAESMIKVEKGEDNILQIDNEVFLKAQDGMIIAGLSADDVKNSLKALEDESGRLFTKKTRRFAPKDFAWIHADPEVAKALDEDNDLDLEEVKKYVAKPLDVEYGFMRVPGNFLLSMATNIKEALTKEYLEKSGLNRDIPNVKGGWLNLANAGTKAPLLAFGGFLNIAGLKATDEGKDIWKELAKAAKNTLNISEDDLTKLLTGALSLAVNDSVSIEGIKVPAVYVSQTSEAGTAEKVFGILEKSPHFHKVSDGVLQIDSSVSPVPCLVTRNGDTLGINLAELANVAKNPELKPALKELTETEASSAVWLDFAAIQSWILAPENGVLTLLEPIARFSGQGEIFDAVKDVLNAKFSVPSMSIHSDSFEVIHTEFQIDEEVKAEDGIMVQLVKAGKKFMDLAKTEDKPEESK